MPKKIFSVFLAFLLIFVPISSACAFEPTGIELTAKSIMLVSLDTGEVLYSKSENERVYPASITKIMVITLMLESPDFDPNKKIAMTAEAQKLVLGTGSVVSNLQVGEEISSLDLVYYVLMSSCGDCAYLAAMTYGGTVENFVDMMNKKAKKLGLSGTHYQNPVGLHDPQNYTTAKDTYTLTAYALKNETFKEVCETVRYTVPETNMHPARTISTTNFLQDSSTNYFYAYAKGVKTGYTTEAGRCLVSTASYNGYNYLCVIFGCPNTEGKRHEFIESKELYRWAFNNFSFKEIADTDNPVCEIGVSLSFQKDFVTLYTQKEFVSVLPSDADDSTITIKPNYENKSVKAPVKKGQVLGTADIIYANNVIGKVNLVSREDIDRNILLAGFDILKTFFTSKYMKAVYAVIALLIVIFIWRLWSLNLRKKTKNRKKIKYIPYDKNKRGKH
ncbi:MAG: D-alanyl-D-alanine carboxypeptidase [Clostridia bacterium]|nr:D-alanyl-D-alanine carboxypeptidase [Clostridia bacterium]